MNFRERFNILTSKYFSDQLTQSEKQELENILRTNNSYKKEFKEITVLNTVFGSNKPKEETLKAFKRFTKATQKPKKLKHFIGYAAIILGVLFTITAYYYTNNNNKNTLVIKQEDITLYNANGHSEKIIIDNDTSAEGLEVGKKITYKNKIIDSVTKPANYTLKVPFGKKFKITLSDGTKVHLNSGSTLTYPSSFSNKKIREVHLNGEAFFDVASNRKKPFIVKTSTLNATVLGTKFNISSYKNDNTNSVVLVEGSVGVTIKNNESESKTLILRPKQKAIINKNSKQNEPKLIKQKITLTEVIKDISWKNRELIFNNDSFSTITKKLERHFNVKIVSENKKLNQIEFTGKFMKQNVFEILDAFKVHTPFKYTIKSNKIIIKK